MTGFSFNPHSTHQSCLFWNRALQPADTQLVDLHWWFVMDSPCDPPEDGTQFHSPSQSSTITWLCEWFFRLLLAVSFNSAPSSSWELPESCGGNVKVILETFVHLVHRIQQQNTGGLRKSLILSSSNTCIYLHRERCTEWRHLFAVLYNSKVPLHNWCPLPHSFECVTTNVYGLRQKPIITSSYERNGECECERNGKREKMCNHRNSNMKWEMRRKGKRGEGDRYCKRNHE